MLVRALRTQQVLAYETGVTRTVDPLAGSWFVEGLTDEMEADANKMIGEIDDMGGVVEGIHRGYFRRSIAEASYRRPLAAPLSSITCASLDKERLSKAAGTSQARHRAGVFNSHLF